MVDMEAVLGQCPLFLSLFYEDASETDFVGRIEKGSSNMATEKCRTK